MHNIYSIKYIYTDALHDENQIQKTGNESIDDKVSPDKGKSFFIIKLLCTNEILSEEIFWKRVKDFKSFSLENCCFLYLLVVKFTVIIKYIKKKKFISFSITIMPL